MLPFYSLLEQPNHTCADPSRPTFSSTRRIDLQRTNQQLLHANSQSAQQRAFEQTCGAQTWVAQQQQQRDVMRQAKAEEEKKQWDRLDTQLAYPAPPAAHSEEDIKSDRSTRRCQVDTARRQHNGATVSALTFFYSLCALLALTCPR